MGIKIDFEKKFIVNGQEYQFWQEVPEELRRLGGSALSPDQNLPSGGRPIPQPVVFNGKEYADITAMPEEERKLFEMILQTLKIEGDAPARESSTLKSPGGEKGALSLEAYRKRKALTPSFSPHWLLKGIVILGLLGGVYYFLQ